MLLRGNLVEEKLLGAAAPITIGQRLSCTLSLPVEGMPAEHVLFAVDEGRFVLRTTRAMEGRLAQDHTPTVFSGETSALLGNGARGKVMIGEATILFQEVATPPVAPRPQLPASIRGSIFDRVDARLALLVGGSLLVHGALAVWAWAQDTDTGVMGKPSVAMTYMPDSVEIFLPDDIQAIDPIPGDPTPGVAAPITPSRNVTPPMNQHIANAPVDAAKMREDAIAMANLLANPTSSKTGVDGSMAPRRPGADLNMQIRDVQGTRIEIGTPSRGRDGSPIRIGTSDKPIIDGDPTQLDTVGHKPEELPTRITVVPGPPLEGVPMPEAILGKINRIYMAGLQRCYVTGLKTDASLAGKIALAFTVNESGRVVDARARGVGGGVDACISSQMTGWTFAVPRDRDGEATDASFGLALQLTR